MAPFHCACSLLMFARFAPFVAGDAGSECSVQKPCDPSANFVCLPPPPSTCQCPAGFHTEERGRTCVSGADVAQPCQTTAACRSGLECRASQCQCPLTTPHWNRRELKCQIQEAAHEVACTSSSANACHAAGTLTWRVCEGGECVCQWPMPNWNNDFTRCECTDDSCRSPRICNQNKLCMCPITSTAIPFYNSVTNTCDPPCTRCPKPRNCDYNECKCPAAAPDWNELTSDCEGRPRPGPGCNNEACQTPLTCQGGVCKCPEADQSYVEGACVGGKQIFVGPCATDGGCASERSLTCINSVCACAEGLVWAESVCKVKADLIQCDPNTEPNECHDQALQNLECDADERICRCPDAYVYSAASKSCKLQAGENCVLNNTYAHELCASNKCDKSEVSSSIRTCACPNEGGIQHIWSSEDGVGCVIDYHGFQCNNDKECRPLKFNEERPGLVCRNGRCACGDGRSYFQGYCVIGVREDLQECDPHGIEPTCRTDALLTCQDTGKGKFRCACLPKIFPPRGKSRSTVTIVTLKWDSAQKVCDLLPNGAPCFRIHECKSGNCNLKKNVCENRVSKSLALVINPLKFLLVILTISLLNYHHRTLF